MFRVLQCLIVVCFGCLVANSGELLIEHIERCIANAEKGESSLTQDILGIEGMSSPKVRLLLNNLCTLQETSYLEVGVCKGSTWISALYNNASTISAATAIDNWSEFGGPKNDFLNNCNLYLEGRDYQFFEANCFRFNLSQIATPINIYFYDGGHTKKDQTRAFTYFNSIFADCFIAIVDDWNHPPVSIGTREAFKKLKYNILYERILPANFNGDIENWWNGIGIFVIQKP